MMAAAIAFALWYSTTPTPPPPSAFTGQAAQLGANVSAAMASAPAAQTGIVHERVLLKLVTPAIVDASERWLREFYHSPIGTEQHVVVAGRELVFILQWHYHPPGFVGGPTGKHRGVTVFEER